MEDFDPQEIIEAVERIREAFNRAAENDSGAATPYFQRLAKALERLKQIENDPSMLDIDPQRPQDIMRLMMTFMPLVQDVRNSGKRIQELAQTDDKAAATLNALRQEVQAETQQLLPKLGGLLGNLPKFPGMPDLGDFNRDAEQPKPKPEAKPQPKQPRPPRRKGGGNYDL